MLEDREYMRRGSGRNDNRQGSGYQALLMLIVVNTLISLLFRGSSGMTLNVGACQDGDLFPIVTALFMHEGIWHLFFNMFSLYIFGSLSAPILGGRTFVLLFLFSGIFGNLVWLASAWHNPYLSVLGASGAVMGTLIATAMIRPDVEMLLLFVPFPIKLRTMALVFVGLDIFGELSGGFSNVAYMAHIGGFLGGLIFMLLFQKRMIQWNPLAFLSGTRGSAQNRGDWTIHDAKTYDSDSSSPNFQNHDSAVTQGELDYLLDKISRQGINSLTEAEMDRLRQAREQMKQGR